MIRVTNFVIFSSLCILKGFPLIIIVIIIIEGSNPSLPHVPFPLHNAPLDIPEGRPEIDFQDS